MNAELLTMANEAFDMFLFLATELIILFLAISYLVGVLQEFVTPEKIQSMLSSRKGKGYVVAALLGSITPFCSCSTIPFLKGLLRAKAGFGPMMVFLFASPLLNPVIIGLLVITFGLKVAVSYFLVAMSVSVIAGIVLEKLGFERYIKPEAYEAVSTSSCGGSTESKTSGCGSKAETETKTETSSCCGSQAAKEQDKAQAKFEVKAESTCCGTEPKTAETTVKTESKTSCCASENSGVKSEKVPGRWMKIWLSTWRDFKQVFPYLMLGITLGSFIYGFVPTELIVEYAGEDTWYAILIAAVIGIPLYIRAEAVIPLSASLVQKGMALGSVMALIIGSAGASLTEVILLKSIFKNQMIAAFLTVILSMAVAAGFLYSYL